LQLHGFTKLLTSHSHILTRHNYCPDKTEQEGMSSAAKLFGSEFRCKNKFLR
jgi:hypothetical protein